MYPTIEDLKTIAESGVYRRIPVAREIYSDCFTPIEVMSAEGGQPPLLSFGKRRR